MSRSRSIDRPAPDLAVTGVNFADFPVIDSNNPHSPVPERKAFVRKVLSMNPGQLLLSAGEYGRFNTAHNPVAEFDVDESFAEGRRVSRQGVFFGSLTLGSESYPPTHDLVAVKPYDDRVRKGGVDFGMPPSNALAHEWSINTYLNNLSSGVAYKPVGVWRSHEEYRVPRLLTAFHARSTSLDNVFRPDQQTDPITPSMVRRALQLGHFGLGLVHGARLIHGDSLPQNFAFDGDRVLLNDTTSLAAFDKSDRVNVPKLGIDVTAFNEGAVDDATSTPEARAIVLDFFHNGNFTDGLYQKYMNGLNLGAKRAGFDSIGAHVPQDAHQQIIDKIAQTYTTKPF